ncbi:Pr6Pr family membrane protein [Streptomyces sp. NRRL S-237]|uniref:Pr6Pr family membrane protein n=1 Tax=Streptomyces sp. NRRL S-237 TaxID=1463895 RepID=UPI003B63EDD1
MQRLRVIRPTFRYPRCSTLPVAVAVAVAVAILTSAGAVVGVVIAAVEGGAGHALGYFTVQSNLLAAYFCALSVRRNHPARTAPSAAPTGAAVISVSVAGMVFHLHGMGDAPVANIAGVASWSALSSQLMHTWVPLGAVATWLLLTPPGRFSLRHTAEWMLVALGYPGFVLVRVGRRPSCGAQDAHKVSDLRKTGSRRGMPQRFSRTGVDRCSPLRRACAGHGSADPVALHIENVTVAPLADTGLWIMYRSLWRDHADTTAPAHSPAGAALSGRRT